MDGTGNKNILIKPEPPYKVGEIYAMGRVIEAIPFEGMNRAMRRRMAAYRKQKKHNVQRAKKRK